MHCMNMNLCLKIFLVIAMLHTLGCSVSINRINSSPAVEHLKSGNLSFFTVPTKTIHGLRIDDKRLEEYEKKCCNPFQKNQIYIVPGRHKLSAMVTRRTRDAGYRKDRISCHYTFSQGNNGTFEEIFSVCTPEVFVDHPEQYRH